jgi:hypothetical protein
MTTCGSFAEVRGDDGAYLPISCDMEPGHYGPHRWVFAIVTKDRAQAQAVGWYAATDE